MGMFKPSMYRKDIFDIDYKKLKDKGIRCLVFDLDNTLGLLDHERCPLKTRKLIKGLQKDFLIFIASNNYMRRIKPYMEDLGVGGVAFCMKPSTRGLKKIQKNYGLKKKEMVMIGDQIVTDVLAGKRFHIMTILVDPLGKKDLKITGLNRYWEDKIIHRYEKKGEFKRGNYYD